MIRHPRRFFAGILAVALLAGLMERGWAAIQARGEPGRGAAWIWAGGPHKDGEPIAFYAVRDFALDAVSAKGELVIAADESYIVHLNGRTVGMGSYRGDAPADLYDVTASLEIGGNRLLVELRSSRGAGGLLASLRVDDRTVLVSDASWRIYRHDDLAILRGFALPDGEEPVVWARHPTGRWRLAPPAARPAEMTSSSDARPPRARLYQLPDLEGWHEIPERAAPLTVLGNRFVLDWGQEVSGRLRLKLAADEVGFLYFGHEPPYRDPPANALVVPVAGRGTWIDVDARTFRYVRFGGVRLRKAPDVLPVPPGARTAADGERSTGVFSLEPPRPDSLAEENVRRRIAGLPPAEILQSRSRKDAEEDAKVDKIEP